MNRFFIHGLLNDEMQLIRTLHLLDLLAFCFGMVLFPFISEHGEDAVGQEYRKAQTPDKGNGVEEVGVAGPGINP